MGIQEINEINGDSLPLLSLNHVSFLCKSVRGSVKFYQEVLGFILIKRPSSFKFEGAWLFNYGIGIHLLQRERGANAPTKPSFINPKDNHISFECADMNLVKMKLEEMGIEYVSAVVVEGGVKFDQLFFHDPDGYMIEICDCYKLPVIPLNPCSVLQKHPLAATADLRLALAKDNDWMMDNLIADIIDITF
ncbi:hypothetical protein QJS04_geneDACA001052 [Acorus gramineus]|uniref:VOC domain-containing protein n=1 Tax=Acorus gramineus TaxID=55184 RepID=A0AAV9AAY0_ACOGR|nr:hypothetical protein QJS04_geneDACA001052 [Acorus gramineus]